MLLDDTTAAPLERFELQPGALHSPLGTGSCLALHFTQGTTSWDVSLTTLKMRRNDQKTDKPTLATITVCANRRVLPATLHPPPPQGSRCHLST